MSRGQERREIIEFQRFLEQVVGDALEIKATDIHFISDNKYCNIKMRINDQLVPYKEIKHEFYERLVLYLKFMSNMNLNISKSPQSSAINIKINNNLMRIRISTLPSYDSESIVLRINHHQYNGQVGSLLLEPEKEKIFLKYLNQNNGLILLTGPTCSGKTTLTYNLLNQLKKQGLSIVTIEDPVENYETGLVQLQVNENAGVNYDTGVKEILRHDPDIIFIGEIRDAHTAKSVIRASLTGHVVISTMHSTSALKALFRLLEFGLSRMDLEQTLMLVANQRLVLYKDTKKIVFEYLNQKQIISALESLSSNKVFHYRTIDDILKDYKVEVVMKR